MSAVIDPPTTTEFCPKCGEESFEVVVTHSGKSLNHTFGLTEHWFEGEGTCYECGYRGWYGDSSL